MKKYFGHGYSMGGRQSEATVKANAQPVVMALHKLREQNLTDEEKMLIEEYKRLPFPDPVRLHVLKRRGLIAFIESKPLPEEK